MSEKSAIGWTDHTFNPWWGCIRKTVDGRLDEACRNCYADAWARRTGHSNLWSGDFRFFGDRHWNDPLRWNRRAEKTGIPERVFCASMADVFQDHPDLVEPRRRLFALIRETESLRWLLLTKRPENVFRMMPEEWDIFVYSDREVPGWPRHAWLGVSVSDQATANERLPLLRDLPCAGRFVSYSPAIGPVNFSESLDWLIAEGESGARARPSHPDFFRSARDQAVAAGVPFFFKQWGEWIPFGNPACPDDPLGGCLPGEESDRSKILSGPDGQIRTYRVGVKAAGAALDGRTWEEVPSF